MFLPFALALAVLVVDASKDKLPLPTPEPQIIEETCTITIEKIRTKRWNGWHTEYGAPDTVCVRTPIF